MHSTWISNIVLGRMVLAASMIEWGPFTIFAVTFFASMFCGGACLLQSEHQLTWRRIAASLMYYGAAGACVSMLGFEWLGATATPWRVIGAGMAVGLGVIQIHQIIPWLLYRRFELPSFKHGPPSDGQRSQAIDKDDDHD